MQFDTKYFVKQKFTAKQVRKNLDNAKRDLKIAQEDSFLEVKFNYAYSALIKVGIVILSAYGWKVRSIARHHVKIINSMAEILNDESIADMGHMMRSKRNRDLYEGGIEITQKECREYVLFSGKLIARALGHPVFISSLRQNKER